MQTDTADNPARSVIYGRSVPVLLASIVTNLHLRLQMHRLYKIKKEPPLIVQQFCRIIIHVPSTVSQCMAKTVVSSILQWRPRHSVYLASSTVYTRLLLAAGLIAIRTFSLLPTSKGPPPFNHVIHHVSFFSVKNRGRSRVS